MRDNPRQQFLNWVKHQHPDIYARFARDPALMLKAGSPTTGRGSRTRRGREEKRWIGARWNPLRGGYDVLGQGAENFIPGANAPPTPAKEPSWFDKIMSFATPLLQAKQQKELFDLQLKRADRGLPPLPVEQYAPGVRVTAGIDKSVWMPLAIAGGTLAVLVVVPQLLRARSTRSRRRG